jgi:hypothetical protein
MNSRIMRVRSSNAACSAEIFFFLFAIVFDDLLSDTTYFFAEVGESHRDDVLHFPVHRRMVIARFVPGKWPFQTRRLQTQIESSPPRQGVRSNQP